MNTLYRPPRPGHYHRPSGVHIRPCEGSSIAVCDYPLRVVRLSDMAKCLLLLCEEEHTVEELAQAAQLPIKKVEALCDQLRWKGLLEAGPALPPPTWPCVSIVIPSYNRAKELERCLHSLFVLDYPIQCLEIVIVDDASTDETNSLLERMAQEATGRDLNLHIVQHERQQGVGISRNTGAEAAHYELLAYIDSDCVASQSWLRNIVPAFQDTRIAAVGGMVRAHKRHTLLGRYEDVRSSLFMGTRPQQVRLEGPVTYLPTANMLMRRAIWQQLGGFAPMTHGEDVNFCRRLLTSGASILYLPQGVVYHDYRTTLGTFLRVRADYAASEAPLLQRHPTERRILVLPPEQAMFAGSVIGGAWSMVAHVGAHFIAPLFIAPLDEQGLDGWNIVQGRKKARGHNKAQGRNKARGRNKVRPYIFVFLLCVLIALLITLFSTRKRLQKVQEQRIPIGPLTVLQATLRSHLAYTYHLCRHLTRYYTLPLLMLSLLVPPLLLLTCILCGIVIGVDYVRLRPDMGLMEFALCSLFDDCAYEVGVVRGCVRHRMWKPLVPVIKQRV
jgi:mycofactocin glycosyltransferase